jgi:hypothetical protein
MAISLHRLVETWGVCLILAHFRPWFESRQGDITGQN